MYFEDDIFTFLAKNDMDLKFKGTGLLEKSFNNRLFKEAIEDSGYSTNYLSNLLDMQFQYNKRNFPFKTNDEGYEMHLHTLGMIRRFEKDDFGLGKPKHKETASSDLLNNCLESEISFLSRKFIEAEENNESAYYQNYIMKLFNDALNFYTSTPKEIKESLIKEFELVRNNKNEENLIPKCRTYVRLIGMLEKNENYEEKVDTNIEYEEEEIEYDEVVDDILDEDFKDDDSDDLDFI